MKKLILLIFISTIFIQINGCGSSSGVPEGTSLRSSVFTIDGLPGLVAMHDMQAQSDNSLLVLGVYLESESPFTYNGIVFKLLSDGSLDKDFGTDGYTILPDVASPTIHLPSLVIDDAGKIYVSGTLAAGIEPEIAFVACLSAEGIIDLGFGDSGIATYAYSGPYYYWTTGGGIDLQNDGKIILGYRVNYTDGTGQSLYEYGLSRFNTDGTLDETFVTGEEDFKNDQYYGVNIDNFIVSTGDSIVLVLNYISFPSDANEIVSLTSSGKINTAFGNQGYKDLSEDSLHRAQILSSQTDRIIAVGYNTLAAPTGPEIRLIAYDSSGDLDTSFGAEGTALINIVDAAIDNIILVHMIEETDGEILVLMFQGSPESESHSLYLARLSSDGILDTTFADKGIWKYESPDFILSKPQIVALPDGTIFIGATWGTTNVDEENFLLKVAVDN